MKNQDNRIILEQLALEIAKSQAEKNRAQWAEHDGDDALGKTIATTLAKIGFDEKGIPGVRPHLLEMVQRGEISVRSTFNDLPPGKKTDISANMEGWYLSREDADKVRDYLLPGKRETQGNNSIDHSGATEKAGPAVTASGVPKGEIVSADWPLSGKFNQDSLSNALSDVPNWLMPARVALGSPGKASALWNPAKLADCLVSKRHANQKAICLFLGRHFAEWLPEWERLQEYS